MPVRFIKSGFITARLLLSAAVAVIGAQWQPAMMRDSTKAEEDS